LLVEDQPNRVVCGGIDAALSDETMKDQFETISMIDLATVEGGTFKSAFGRAQEERILGMQKGEANGQRIGGVVGGKVGKGIGAVGGFVKGFSLDVWDDLKNR
jgi:hypothetical protein